MIFCRTDRNAILCIRNHNVTFCKRTHNEFPIYTDGFIGKVEVEGGLCTGSDIVNPSAEDCIAIPSAETYIVIPFTENYIVIPLTKICIVIHPQT